MAQWWRPYTTLAVKSLKFGCKNYVSHLMTALTLVARDSKSSSGSSGHLYSSAYTTQRNIIKHKIKY